MSAKIHQTSTSPAFPYGHAPAHSGFSTIPFQSVMPAPISAPTFYTVKPEAPAPVVPGAQTAARIFPVLEADGVGPFTSFPSAHVDNENYGLLYTYASFNEEPILALSANKRDDDTWTLCLPVPLPPTSNPTLRALTYLLKYATTGDNGNSTVQTDVLLTAAAPPAGIAPWPASHGVYRPGSGYAPRMVDAAWAHRLATALAEKSNGGGEGWSHFLDVQHLAPNVRVTDGVQPYVMFHVAEYPTARTVRSLAVEVSATWQREAVELIALAEAKRKADDAAEKATQEAAAKENREEEEKQARDHARQWMNDEREHRKAEAEEWKRAEDTRVDEKAWRVEERRTWNEREAREAAAAAAAATAAQAAPVPAATGPFSLVDAPAVADAAMQSFVEKKMAELKLKPCSSGLPFERYEDGYRCTGGGHSITFEQLGMKDFYTLTWGVLLPARTRG
ncbi:hypothetical protein DFH08DRAFT_1027772 [Mycena albidolilacea]|uniref:Uncharacterized protein n=1 Tax=Mycena albidolilacea TaxID=1033008 RepID=A0AAD7EHC2_9AGAR|nr:hypothetical protein DFH08DRAFT_1027772 [Mycena albidolilacea]